MTRAGAATFGTTDAELRGIIADDSRPKILTKSETNAWLFHVVVWDTVDVEIEESSLSGRSSTNTWKI